MPAPIVFSGTAHGYTLYLGDTTASGAQSILVFASTASSDTITDNKGNTYSLLGSFFSGAYVRIYVYVTDLPALGADHRIFAGATYTEITAAGLSRRQSDIDAGPVGAGSATGVTSLSSGGVTPTQDGDFLLAITANGTAVTSSAIAGFTALESAAASSGVNVGAFLAYKQLGAGTSGALQNPTHSWTTSDADVVAAIIALKMPAAGTPPGLATETDTALALAGKQIRAAGMATETDTALALVTLAGLPFNTAPYEFGQRTGLDVDDFSLYASTSLNVSVYAATDVLLASQLFAYTESTGTDGRLTRKTHASLTAGTTYIFVAVTTGGALVAAGRITAT